MKREKASLVRLLMESGKDSTFNIIIICVAVALTGTFYYYERRFAFSTDICVLITFAIFAVWIWFALICGKEKKLGFIIFAYAYWLVPYLYTLFYSYYKIDGRYIKWLAMVNRVASGMLKNPFYVLSVRMKADPVAIAAVLLITVMLVYAFGNVSTYFYDKKPERLHEAAIKKEDSETELIHSVTDQDLKDWLFGSADNADTVIDNKKEQEFLQEEEEYDDER